MTKEVEKLIEDAERLYTTLEVEKMRQAIEQSSITEEDFKALLLDIVEPEAIVTFCSDKPSQDRSGKV